MEETACLPEISVVVPFFNEEASLHTLYAEITQVLSELDLKYELIFVDDGSTDASAQSVESMVEKDSRVRLVQLRGNYGKTAALSAGFDHCKGDRIFTMDADLQDNPGEIPRFLRKLDEGYDLVSGYKQTRNDPWHKVYPSRVFNAMVRRMTGIALHDVNCGFKCYRRPVIEEVCLYGELHRFVPVLAHWHRFRIGELVVAHRARQAGVSKFGLERIYRGFIDLLSVAFLLRYERNPAHFFGKLGLGFAGAGFLICLYLSILWFAGHRPIGNRPLLFLGILLMIVGVQFFSNGLIGELFTHATRQREKPYGIARVLRQQQTASGSEMLNDGQQGSREAIVARQPVVPGGALGPDPTLSNG